jgi:isocitrate lyase
MGLLGGSLALMLCVGGWWLLQTTTANSSSSSVTEHAGPLSSASQATVQRLVRALAARDRRQALAELTQLQQQEPRSEALIQSLKSATLALPQAP